MSTFDADVVAALDEVREECGRPVLIRRDAMTRAITAIPGNTRSTVETSQHQRLSQDIQDFVFQSSDYHFGGNPVEPLPGDEILDLGRRYEVTRLGDQTPAWSWCDRAHQYFRVHTLETGAAD